MRGRSAGFLGLLSLVTLGALSGCVPLQGEEPPIRSPGAPGAEQLPLAPHAALPPGAVPAWVPAFTAEQAKLLEPAGRAPEVRADRVFPDLERFGYAPPRLLARPEDAMKFTKMVATVLDRSPVLYVLQVAPPSAANLVGQYGPAPSAPDGYQVVRRRADGVGELVPAPRAAEARAAMAAVPHDENAAAALRALGAKFPGVPAIPDALGEVLERSGQIADAEAAYRAAITIDPTFAPPHASLANLAQKKGDLPVARREVAEALSLDPHSKKANEIAVRLAAKGEVEKGAVLRPHPFAMFLDVDRTGAVHTAAAASDAAQIYGGCRAVLRYEPEVRGRLLNQPKNGPYFLSMNEEVVCHEAALGAYFAGRANGKTAPDAELDELFRTAREEGLGGYVMFEILGHHRPERARTAPPDVHQAMMGYIDRHVLALGPRLAQGSFTAMR